MIDQDRGRPRVLINAISASRGGGRTILRGLLDAIKTSNALACDYYVACPDSSPEPFRGSIRVKVIKCNVGRLGLVSQLKYYWRGLADLAGALSIDVVFNLADVIPRVACPQVYYFDWAYLVCRERQVWSKLSLAERGYRRLKAAAVVGSISRVSAAVAQNDLMRERLGALAPELPVHVIPPFVRLPNRLPHIHWSDCVQLLCLSHYAPHKDLGLLLEVAKLLQGTGEQITISVTIGECGCRRTRRLLREIRRKKLGDYLRAIGPQDVSELGSLMNRHHALFVPSLLESFGLTYFEAMSSGRTLIVADTPYSRIACGESAFYFPASDAAEALAQIRRAWQCADLRNHRLAFGLDIARQLPTPNASMDRLDQILYAVARK